MKVLPWKNLYIADSAENVFKGIKFDFHKFLYFRHLETLHSSSFSTISNFLFNQSVAFAGPRKVFLAFLKHNKCM